MQHGPDLKDFSYRTSVPNRIHVQKKILSYMATDPMQLNDRLLKNVLLPSPFPRLPL
jgi:hypothetical protein